MANQSIADRLLSIDAHPLKATLHDLGFTQSHAARHIGRGELYLWQRLNGYRPFKPAEEAALHELVAKAEGMLREGGV